MGPGSGCQTLNRPLASTGSSGAELLWAYWLVDVMSGPYTLVASGSGVRDCAATLPALGLGDLKETPSPESEVQVLGHMSGP